MSDTTAAPLSLTERARRYAECFRLTDSQWDAYDRLCSVYGLTDSRTPFRIAANNFCGACGRYHSRKVNC